MRNGDTIGQEKPSLDAFCVTIAVLHFSLMCYSNAKESKIGLHTENKVVYREKILTEHEIVD